MAAIVGLLLKPVQTWFFFSECTGSLEGVRCGEGEPCKSRSLSPVKWADCPLVSGYRSCSRWRFR